MTVPWRNITIGLGGPANGYPRADGFNIAVASEVMAIFCLATSLQDLKERLGKIVVAYTRDLKPILASDLKAHGAMAALLKDAIKPNMVQTLENNLAFIHGGPFANIATGSNSVIATKSALKLADYVVTESGFGADLGRRNLSISFAGNPDCAPTAPLSLSRFVPSNTTAVSICLIWARKISLHLKKALPS